ncbi:hypothetical protein [Massilia glaciei]|nr:hypothetical protein [Massilia glaciei]
MQTKKAFKIFTLAVAACFGLVLVLYLILLAVNWRDQPVGQAAARLAALSTGRAALAEGDNAYVFLMGFQVAPNEDPRAWGQKRIAWSRQMAALPNIPDGAVPPGADTNFKAARTPEVQALSDACRTAEQACVDAIGKGEATIAAWAASERWLFERYRALLAHQAWREDMPYDMRFPMPAFHPVFEGQKLLHLKAWTLAGQGDAAGVKALLEADIRFWRLGLASSEMLISKMIAVAAINRHFSLGALALRRLPAQSAMQAMPQQWLAPVSDAERSMLRPFAGELRFAENALRRTDAPEAMREYDVTWGGKMATGVFKPLMQIQDTSNRYAEVLASVEDALRVPYAQLPQALVRASNITDAVAKKGPMPDRMYNPVGDMFLRVGIPDFTNYAARVTDLEGVRRLAALTVGLHSRAVPAAQLRHQLAAADERNPYDGKPFQWDEKTGAILFVGLSEGERGRHAFIY